jgi:hypothetical protein
MFTHFLYVGVKITNIINLNKNSNVNKTTHRFCRYYILRTWYENINETAVLREYGREIMHLHSLHKTFQRNTRLVVMSLV